MGKIGRNDPCPCGSGKKYKHCCLDKDDTATGEHNPAADFREELQKAIGDRVFESIEEANAFVRQFMDKKNKTPQLDFLGLSADQMHRLLYSPLEDLEDIIRFNHGLGPEAFKDIPVVKNVIYFLTRLEDLGPVKATAKGNLPLAFAKELHSYFNRPSRQYHFQIRSEEESVLVNSLRHILTMCGWIKKVNNRFSLTKKGRAIQQTVFAETHFFALLKIFARSFNWAFMDASYEFRFIQTACVFSLYMLHLKAGDYTDEDILMDYFIRAFPMVLSETEGSMYIDPEDLLKISFSLRFLERFCEYFGFIDVKRENVSDFRLKLIVKRSSFFDKYIDWSNFT